MLFILLWRLTGGQCGPHCTRSTRWTWNNLTIHGTSQRQYTYVNLMRKKRLCDTPRVRDSCVNPFLTEVYGNASGTRSTEKISYGWADDQQIPQLIWNLKVHNLLIRIPPVISILRNIKPEHTLKPFLLRSYLILSYNLWWGLSAFLPNCIICLMHTTCLAHLNLFDTLRHVIDV